MAVKYKTVTLAHSDPSFLNQELRDFLVNDCGWTDNTPAAQDDDFNFGLGFFLESTGEDGLSQMYMHLWSQYAYNTYVPPKMSYLSADITTTGQMSCTVLDGTLYPASGPFWIRINGELIICSGTSGNTISFTQRGAGGTTAATHLTNDCVGLTSEGCQSTIEMFMHQDVSGAGAIAAASGAASLARDNVSAVPGLTGYGDRRFNYHAFLRVTSGSEIGKMRAITDYDDTGDFTYQPFLNTPGSNTSEIVMAGFNPGCSRRMCDVSFSSADMCSQMLPRNSNGDTTTYFFYGSKDGVLVIAKYNSTYYTCYAGNLVPYASKLTTTISSGVSAGATSVVVANRHLFVEGEKYRIMSTDVDDWGDNEDRSAEDPAGNWPDLDPEELPSEEFVVDTITPGSGDIGTIGLTSALVYSYRTGAEVGEDPRPSVLAGIQQGSVWADIASADIYAALHLYMNTKKENLAIDASHRQMIRAYHNTSRWVPYASSFTLAPADVLTSVGPIGIRAPSVTSAIGPSYQTHRYVGGLYSVIALYSSAQVVRGRWQNVKGTIPYIWWFDAPNTSPPYGGSAEDTLKAWWGSQFETFRLFLSESGNVWFAAGPEIP